MTSTTYAFHTLWGPLDGRIHEPETTPAAGVVVVTGSWLTVKEQMPLRYAEALTERGFTAVTFDFPGFGGSAGALRQAELPGQKVAVIAEIARQVAELGVVPGRKVGHLAVCASAQYALTALAEGAPISALVSVAGWFHDPATVADLYGGPDGVRERLERGRQAAARYLADGTVNTVPAYREGDENAAMFIELDYYADTARGAIPAWNNEMAELSWDRGSASTDFPRPPPTSTPLCSSCIATTVSCPTTCVTSPKASPAPRCSGPTDSRPISTTSIPRWASPPMLPRTTSARTWSRAPR